MICTSLVLGVHLATYHFDRNTEYQEFNPGVSVACDNYQVGIYRNSENGTSIYGVKNYKNVIPHMDVAIGAVTGYKASILVPLIIPSTKLGKARISLLMPFQKHSGGVHLSWEF